MAITKKQRKEKLEEIKMLQSLSKVNEEVDLSGISKGSIKDLHSLEKFLDDKELAYLGESKRKDAMDSGFDVLVSIFFMSTKTVKVDSDENFLSIGYSFNEYGDNVDTYTIDDNSKITLEEFIELPKVSQSEDSLTTKTIVKLCDADNIYNLYQDRALSIMRKLFAHPYHMFTGGNLYKVRDVKEGTTLYVMYDKIRKKFRYAYNPKFILECAIDEWMLQRDRYKSLEDCYCYLLSFMITHEMLHIIHHNTVASASSGVNDLIDSGDHDVANQVQDSFINCKIARRFIGADGIKSQRSRSIAPIPRIGIGSKITVRAEHNNGLKEFNSTGDLAKLIHKILSESLIVSRDDVTLKNRSYSSGVDISNLAGADVFITVDVNPTFSPLRSNGSNVFQRVVNDVIKAITDGKVHGKYTKISNAEKASDLDVLPVGTIVLVKGVRDIAYVESYNSDTKLYNLTKSEITGTTKTPLPDGTTLCTPVYNNTGVAYGTRTRIQIKPYNPDDDSYIESPQVKRDKLTPEELKQAKQAKQDSNQGAPMPPMPSPQDNKPTKSFNVGDIVWIRKLKKFGRITVAQDGKFELEEVIEKPAKVIDDSDNYI